MKEFTKEELARYNGKDDPKKYVAIDGVVYDMTAVPAWGGADHHGNIAGQDLTQALGHSPHGDSVLPKLPVVGKYVG